MNQKRLTKDKSCEYKCRFDGRKCKSNQWWNHDKCRCECKKTHVFEKEYVRNPSKCIFENRKYLESIMDDSMIICDEVKLSNMKHQSRLKVLQKLYIINNVMKL